MLRWMPITLWRSEWTPPGPSTSASRFASSPPRLPDPSDTLEALSLPMTTALAQCSWLMKFAMQSSKRLPISAFAQPQPCSSLSLSFLSSAPYSLLNHPWLRSSLLRPSKSCPWVRLSARHWPRDVAQPQQAFTHGTCRRTQATSLFSPFLQALFLKVPPPDLQLSLPQHASWRILRAACLWTTSRPTHRLIRLLLIPHLHLPTRNLNKRLRKLNIEHWRSCLDPPRHRRLKSAMPQLLPVRRRLQPSCRHLLCRAADAVAAAAGRELLRITPWKRLLRRASKSTCRSPSGAFRGGRIHSSLPSPTDCLAPNLLSSALLYQGAARSQDVPEERWPRFPKCIADFPTSMRQIKSNVHSIWVRCLPCDPRPSASLAAAFHVPSLPYLRSCTLSYNRSPASQCNSWPRRYSAQNTAHNLVPPPVAGIGMASRKERRQDRQSRRPGSLNRRFTNAPSEDAAVTAPTVNPTPAADVCSAPPDEPCRLTLKEVALLNYVSWKGRAGKPPPLTVYAEPSLQHVLRGLRQKQRQPLTTPEDEV